jgi:hypothetical protein
MNRYALTVNISLINLTAHAIDSSIESIEMIHLSNFSKIGGNPHIKLYAI